MLERHFLILASLFPLSVVPACADEAGDGPLTSAEERDSVNDGDESDDSDDDDDVSSPSEAGSSTRDAGAESGRDARAEARMDAASLTDARASESSDDAAHEADAGDASEPPLPGMQPIPAPVADDCITDVAPGDHTFTCSGVTFLTLVPELCTQFACGLIFDVHGATMSGKQMRDNTQLHELAPPHGFIVVHPSATPSKTGGTWNLSEDPPKVADFYQRMTKAFHVDAKRTHFTGFSQGAAHTFYMMCNHSDLLASAAPLSGNSADVSCITRDWEPRIPFLFMSGITDASLAIETSRMRWEGFVRELELTGGEVVDTDGHYTRKHWQDPSGLDFDYIEHDYGGQPALAGHCVPGGVDTPGAANNFVLNATTCTSGEIDLHWGETALQWFLEHPRH